MNFEIIAGLVVVILGAIAAAFGITMLAAPVKQKRKPVSSVAKRTHRQRRRSRT